MDPLKNCVGFEWDESNTGKNWEKHRVTPEEAEEIFFQEPCVVRGDIRHSQSEKRYYALGRTATGRRMFVAFTLRGQLIRVISVRNMNKKELQAYTKYEEESA